MKTIINNTLRALGALAAPALLSASLTSCGDFLSIEPMNEIVLENYWTEEADVQSMINACYSQLESQDCISRMIAWGEMRSDNMTTGAGTPNDVQQILKENLLESNPYAKWEAFYKAIGYCNTVIHYAPGVAEIDPNFTSDECNATIAEATTLRALCYFYLIRAFRDVPFVTEPSLDDSQNYQVAATPFDEVLNRLISDVEGVKNNAMRTWGEKSHQNYTRITRAACNALLADLYLWRGDWQKCIDCCEEVMAEKRQEYDEDFQQNPTSMTTLLFEDYPLIAEAMGSSAFAGTAYTEIFSEGCSFESIFELTFDLSQRESISNKSVSTFYGSSSTRDSGGQVGAPTFLYEGISDGTNKYFPNKTDCRYIENLRMLNNKYYISKYIYTDIRFRTSTTTGDAPEPTVTYRTDDCASWIIYRLTDVMLMRAEAEVELAGNVMEGSSPSAEQMEHYQNAYKLVLAVWRRANNKRTESAGIPVLADYSGSRRDMEDFVLAERERELMFEGKRWFDLLRVSRRDGNSERLVSFVTPKFVDGSSTIALRLASADALYWPIYRDELKQNPQLHQNPAYKSENTEKN